MTVNDALAGFPGFPNLLHQLAEDLAHLQQATRDLDVTVDLRDGDEVCVSSFNTFESDDFDPDEQLVEDEVCATVTATTSSVDYNLVMTLANCELRVDVTGTVSEAI